MTGNDALSDSTATLGVLGFSAPQEALYRLLLRNPDSSLHELSGITGLADADLREHLAGLTGAGLVEVRGDSGAETGGGVVTARPPQEAPSRLVNEETQRLQSRGDQLETVRELLPSLSAEHLAAAAPRGEQVNVELVEGGDVLQLVRSLTAASTGDLLWLRPDPWNIAVSAELDHWVREVVRAGRRSRAIYPARVLEQAPELIRARADAGEHVRILAEVPFRLAVMGGSAIVLDEEMSAPNGRRVVIRQQSMIKALTVTFESLWEKAMTVPGLEGQRYDDEAGDRRLLLDQLAGGAKDEQIARALTLSVRTVRRRVAGLLDDLGAQSRFQAGVEAVRRGGVLAPRGGG